MRKALSIITLAVSLILVISFAASVPAVAAADDADAAADWVLVEDHALILTDDEWEALLDRAEAITEKYKCDVAIVTIDEMTDDDGAYVWAKYIFDEFGYGYGTDRSGVLFFLSVKERDYSLIAHGYGNTAFTDYGKDVMLDDHILPLLKENKYRDAFSAYLDKAEEFLKLARSGEPFDRGTDPANAGTAILIKLAVVILIPALIAWVICQMWKSQMKTAVPARAAANYIPPGGFNLTGQADMFLYRTQTREKVQTSSSSGGTTTDSSGFSGRSGKY